MDCPSSEALSWQWTPRWCPLFMEMDPRTVELRSVTAWLWWRPGERKERTYPELMAPRSKARLVVIAGRWFPETLTFVRLLAKAKARHEPNLMRKRAEQAWRMRWCSLLGCAAVGRSPRRSWNSGAQGAPMALCLPRTRWRVITGTLV